MSHRPLESFPNYHPIRLPPSISSRGRVPSSSRILFTAAALLVTAAVSARLVSTLNPSMGAVRQEMNRTRQLFYECMGGYGTLCAGNKQVKVNNAGKDFCQECRNVFGLGKKDAMESGRQQGRIPEERNNSMEEWREN